MRIPTKINKKIIYILLTSIIIFTNSCSLLQPKEVAKYKHTNYSHTTYNKDLKNAILAISGSVVLGISAIIITPVGISLSISAMSLSSGAYGIYTFYKIKDIDLSHIQLSYLFQKFQNTSFNFPF
jgi:hypothetical protein